MLCVCVHVCTHVSVCNCYACTIGYEVANKLDARALVLDLSINPLDAMGICLNKQKWMYSVLSS